jgi:hypothetical protein
MSDAKGQAAILEAMIARLSRERRVFFPVRG